MNFDGEEPQTGSFLSGLAPPVGKQYSIGGISSRILWVRSSEGGVGASGRHDDELGGAMDLSGPTGMKWVVLHSEGH